MTDLIEQLARTQKALYELEVMLRSQVGTECLYDPKNSIMASLARARLAVEATRLALEKVK